MKAISIAVLLLCSAAFMAWAELTRDEIAQIIRTELERVGEEIAAVKQDIAERRGEMEAIRGEMKAIRGEAVSKERFLAMWITIFLAILGVPYLYGRADRERVREKEGFG